MPPPLPSGRPGEPASAGRGRTAPDQDALERQIQATSALALAAATVFLIGMNLVMSARFTGIVAMMAAAFLLYLTSFWATRAGWATTGAVLLLGTATGTVAGSYLAFPEDWARHVILIFAFVPVVLASALRQTWLAWAMVALSAAAAGVSPWETREAAAMAWGLFLVFVIAAALLTASTAMRRRAEVRRHLAEKDLRILLDSLDEAAHFVDREGTFTTWNRAADDLFQRLTGHRLQAGVPWVDLVPPQDRAFVAEQLRRALAGERVQGERVVPTPEGDVAIVTSYRPLPDSYGDVRGTVLIVRDVSGERAHERLLEAAARRDAEMDKMREVAEFKTQLLNVAGHELNTPLTPLKLQVQVLRKRLGEDIPLEQARSLDIMTRSADRLAALVGDLLDVARLEASQMKFMFEPVDLVRLVRDETELLSMEAEQKGVAIHVETPASHELRGDAMRLGQVMANLVSNAVKFSPDGGTVSVTVAAEDGKARIEVRDEGIGLTPSAIATLFQPFHRVHEDGDPSVPGTGLGLYICKGIVEAHGGTCGIASEGRGQGTTAWFTVPAVPPTWDAEADEQGGRAASADASRAAEGPSAAPTHDDGGENGPHGDQGGKRRSLGALTGQSR